MYVFAHSETDVIRAAAKDIFFHSLLIDQLIDGSLKPSSQQRLSNHRIATVTRHGTPVKLQI